MRPSAQRRFKRFQGPLWLDLDDLARIVIEDYWHPPKTRLIYNDECIIGAATKRLP